MATCVCLIPEAEASRLREHYRVVLLDDFVPWWEAHSIDRQHGGFFSCLERDGHVYASDKFTWSLARQIWMFSRLHNCVKPEPRWVDIARHGAEFLLAHAFSEDGRLYFRLSRDGRPLVDPQDVYAECFAAVALAELSRATGDSACWDRAVACYERVRDRLGMPTNTPLLGGPMRARFHIYAHDMARLTVASVFQEIATDPRWQHDLSVSAEAAIHLHWKPELGAMLENVAPDGSPMLDLPEGRLLNPGHAIEIAWMLMELARDRGDRSLLDTAIDITIASLDRCWDREHGGLRYLASLDGSPTHPPHADMKLWWPHAETLYALLLGWAATGRQDLADWYRRVHDYAFSAFPDRQYGEWFGWLNREGTPVFTAKADGRKGFFHLPRVFLRCYQLLTSTCGNQSKKE
jgi:N-acylglucosamine 2-epimerase